MAAPPGGRLHFAKPLTFAGALAYNKPMEIQQPRRKQTLIALAIVAAIAAVVGAAIVIITQYAMQTYVAKTEPSAVVQPALDPSKTPELEVTTVVTGLKNPWDVGLLPSGELLVNERRGVVSKVVEGRAVPLLEIADVVAVGEGGLLGLAVDPQFADNRFIYTCFNSKLGSPDVRVVRWKVNAAVDGLTERKDIVTGMPSAGAGRHSGCRVAFGPDGYLWVGTGDAAQPKVTPQDPKSLGGKILRVDREGAVAPGNLPAPFDSRIYSFGHRNTQGLAFLPQPLGDVVGFSAEHGPGLDDEINPLKKGNFGWDPKTGYGEAVPMTDKTKFPDAIDAAWASGNPTQAPSGLAVITGERWQAYNGRLAMAMLKAQHLKILTLNQEGRVIAEEKLLTDKGRIRAVVQAGDRLYVTTDNGQNDEIISMKLKL